MFPLFCPDAKSAKSPEITDDWNRLGTCTGSGAAEMQFKKLLITSQFFFFAGSPSSIGEAALACLEMLTLHWFYVLAWLPDVPEGLQQEHLPDIPQIRDHSPTESLKVPCQGISPCRAASLFLEMFVLQCCAAILPPEMLPVWGCPCDNFFVM